MNSKRFFLIIFLLLLLPLSQAVNLDFEIGRFISTDQIPSGNPYAYVENNPMTFIDANGLTSSLGYEKMQKREKSTLQKVIEFAVSPEDIAAAMAFPEMLGAAPLKKGVSAAGRAGVWRRLGGAIGGGGRWVGRKLVLIS